METSQYNYVDYQNLNAVTECDAYPMLRNDIIDDLVQPHYISTLDLAMNDNNTAPTRLVLLK